jgi:hypothetical protein
MANARHLIIFLLFGLVAVPSHAQTAPNPRRAFLDVALGPNWDDAAYDSTYVPGATVGSGFAFGFDSGSWGLEIDVGVPQWHVMNRAPERYHYGGASYGYHQQGHAYEWSSTRRRRSLNVTALYRGNRPLSRRATFTWLAGAGYVFRPEHVIRVTKEVLGDGQLREVDVYESTSFRNYTAATARLDVEFRIGPRLSVVPRLRVTAFPSFLDDSGAAPRMLMARPEIAARWQF